MIWSLLDTPPEVAAELGLDRTAIARAASSLRNGDAGPAAALIDDELLARLMLLGPPEVVGGRLADLVRTHRPTSIGLAIISHDLAASIDKAAAAFAVMRAVLGADP